MQVELSTEELGMVKQCFDLSEGDLTGVPVFDNLHDRLTAIHNDQVELESMDLNECEGGACKL